VSLATLLNNPVQIIRRSESGSVDEYGNDIPDEMLVETVCELQQTRRDEQDDQGETSETTWLLILPAGTEIRTGDQVTADGMVFELAGDGWAARNPRTGVQSHVEATLKKTSGTEDAS